MTIRARDIRLRLISSQDAAKIVKRFHYSGKVVNKSEIHFGVFVGERCGGALSLGTSTDKRRMAPLVQGTRINEFLELNRMAFADWLPRNSESRALGYTMRYLRKHYPHLKWIVSFADATQCGDGAIYRAAGFVLTQIKKNSALLKMPDGTVRSRIAMDTTDPYVNGRSASSIAKEQGAVPLEGYQLRYVYFLKPECRALLSCPELPFSAIDEAGARMYRGRRRA